VSDIRGVALSGPGIRLVPSPKPGGVRWLVRLDEPAAAEYARRVAAVAPLVDAGLSASVVANRIVATSLEPPCVHLEPWRVARARFRRRVQALSVGASAVLATDVRACYPSITAEVVQGSLHRLACPASDIAAIGEALGAFADAGVRGLPIGPEPSAVLANAVLMAADRALETSGFPYVRWVDDVLVFLGDERDAQHALSALRAGIAVVGLRLAEEKTRVVGDPAAVLAAGPGALSDPGGGTAGRNGNLRSDEDPLPSLARLHALVPDDG
jgi:hypothetical protein